MASAKNAQDVVMQMGKRRKTGLDDSVEERPIRKKVCVLKLIRPTIFSEGYVNIDGHV